MKNLFSIMVILFSVFSSSSVVAKEGFPGRAEYPEIPVYSTEQLAENFDKVVIVDTRSALEYDTLRINGAVNIPVADNNFASRIKQLAKQHKKKIAFYCNGRTCYKSYQAAKIAMRNKVTNVVAYDAGMFEWAQAYPKQATLLGESPVDPNHIIPASRLKSRFIDAKTFTHLARNTPREKFMILDVRDMYQRAGIGFFPGMEKWASLDDEKKLKKYLAKARDENRTLYIYDEAGKQVRWLQYTLERENIRDYYFMSSGAKGFYKEIIN